MLLAHCSPESLAILTLKWPVQIHLVECKQTIFFIKLGSSYSMVSSKIASEPYARGKQMLCVHKLNGAKKSANKANKIRGRAFVDSASFEWQIFVNYNYI